MDWREPVARRILLTRPAMTGEIHPPPSLEALTGCHCGDDGIAFVHRSTLNRSLEPELVREGVQRRDSKRGQERLRVRFRDGGSWEPLTQPDDEQRSLNEGRPLERVARLNLTTTEAIGVSQPLIRGAAAGGP